METLKKFKVSLRIILQSVCLSTLNKFWLNFHYTHELPVIVERDCTCLFITSVNKRQIANHNTDSIWNEGQQRGVSATQRRVIRSFACIRRAHPWHASYWLAETGTRLSHRRSAGVCLEHSYLSWSPRFYPRPLHWKQFSAIPLDVSSCTHQTRPFLKKIFS